MPESTLPPDAVTISGATTFRLSDFHTVSASGGTHTTTPASWATIVDEAMTMPEPVTTPEPDPVPRFVAGDLVRVAERAGHRADGSGLIHSGFLGQEARIIRRHRTSVRGRWEVQVGDRSQVVHENFLTMVRPMEFAPGDRVLVDTHPRASETDHYVDAMFHGAVGVIVGRSRYVSGGESYEVRHRTGTTNNIWRMSLKLVSDSETRPRLRDARGRFVAALPRFTTGDRVQVSNRPISTPQAYADDIAASFRGIVGVITGVGYEADQYSVRRARTDGSWPESQYIHASSMTLIDDGVLHCANGACDAILTSEEDRVATHGRGADGCADCTETCEGCSRVYQSVQYALTTVSVGDAIQELCSNCQTYCDECDTRIPIGMQCPNFDNHPIDRGIRGYGHTHPTMWLGGPLPKTEDGHHDGFYIGFELEISASDEASALPVYEWARDHLGNAGAIECKEDGSVNGFEIVSMPMTPEFFERVDWDDFMAMLNTEYPIRRRTGEPDSHGLHVHIGRVAFERDDVATAAYSYLLGQGDLLERIGRRESTGYCEKVRKPVSVAIVSAANQSGKATKQSEKLRRDNYPGRSAINLLNSNTIEIRAFKSTRSADEFRDAVRLTYLGAEYIRTLRVGRRAVSPKALHISEFARWVGTHHPEAFPSIAGIEKKDSNRKVLVGAGATSTNFNF